jgi:DNA polymerase I-like protein with 3'-5' exonuclease and polymerase domains
MTHSNPNVAQVPRVGSLYGSECRALFVAPPDKRLVGCDAEGLELRCLAHYMARFDDGAYGDTVVNGKKEDGTDVHTVNQRLVGLNTRDAAKTYAYAYLYGAGGLKLGSIIYDDMSAARREAFNAKYPPGAAREKALANLGMKTKRRFEEGLPALGKLQALVKSKATRGYVLSLDGRRVHVRSAHASLNSLLQSAGAVIMKRALVLFDRTAKARGWVHGVDFAYLAQVHDEAQIEARPEIADELGRMYAQSITDAGITFDMKCPLAGAYAVGQNWKDTH